MTRIKNSLLRNHKNVELPSSKFKVKIAEVLKNEGYIINYEVLPKIFEACILFEKMS